MTVTASSPRFVSYAGDGGSGPFTVPFRFLEAGDLTVQLTAADGTRTLLDDCIVTGAGETSGGAVETADPVPAGATLTLWSNTAAVQDADYIAADAFPAETHEGALDRLTLIAQDLRRDVARAVKAPVGDAGPADLTYEQLVEDAAGAVGEEAALLVAAEGAGQVAAVELEGDFQVGRVEDEGDDQLALVTAAGAAQLDLVEGAGTDQLALIAASRAGSLYATTSDALSSGAVAVGAITGGSGGTNGTFNAAITGGGGTGMAIRFVVAGGAVTSAVILAGGVNYTSAPTIGLTGAAITVTLGTLTSVGEYFSTPGTNGAALNVYRVDAGPAATLVTQTWKSDPADPQTLHQVRARLDTQTGAGARAYVEPYPLRMYMGTLSTGTKNTNGTYPLAAAATWTSPQLSAGVFDVPGTRYCYVVLTDEITDAIQITIKRGGTIVAAGNTTTQPSPGVYKQTWNNSGALPYVEIVIANVAVGAVTLYPIEVYTADAAYFPQVIRYDDTTLVPETRRIIDWNGEIYPPSRWASDRGQWVGDENNITNGFDSLGGSDAASGSLYAPKQNLTAGSALAAGSVLGLSRGSVWNQSLNTMIGSVTKGLRVRDYSSGQVFGAFPILDGGIDVGSATWTDETGGCWSTTIACASNLTADGYSYPNVVEITRAEEAAKPLGSSRILVPQSSSANCIATAGSSYGTKPTSTTLKIYIHPTDGVQPSTGGTYKHKVTNLQAPMDWVQGNTRQALVQNMEFWQGAQGLGVVCGSNQSAFDGVIAAHGWTHTLHIEAGEVRNFILYNRGASTNTGNCYITPTATGFSWRWTNGIAYECQSAFYSHAAAGQYGRGEYSYIWTINGRDPTTGSLCLGDPRACDQVAVAEEFWCYDKGYKSAGRAGNSVNPVNCRYHHNLIRECAWFGSRTLTENCIVQVENLSGVGIGDRSMRMARVSENHVVRNNIVYARNTQTTVGDANPTNDYRAIVIDFVTTGLSNPNITKNIFLVDTTRSTGGTVIVTESASITWQSDYNVFIFCTPGNISSAKFGGPSKTTVAEYLSTFTGHDTNSLFVDLRDDPRGAKAVFVDPASGDFRWAQTEVAKRVKAYCDANGAGPEWTLQKWPQVPTVDDARKLLHASR